MSTQGLTHNSQQYIGGEGISPNEPPQDSTITQDNDKHERDSSPQDNNNSETTLQGTAETTGMEATNRGSSPQKDKSPHSFIEQLGKTDNLADTEPNWEKALEWAYEGHGEWVEPINMAEASHHGNPLATEPKWVQQWRAKEDIDIWLYQQVLDKGYPNRWGGGAKIPVKSKWNLTLFESLLHDYQDKEVVERLRYGWPAGRLPTLKDPELNHKNHKGVVDYPEALHKYIQKEQAHGAVMGPYKDIPFNKKVGISPLSTRGKKN